MPGVLGWNCGRAGPPSVICGSHWAAGGEDRPGKMAMILQSIRLNLCTPTDFQRIIEGIVLISRVWRARWRLLQHQPQRRNLARPPAAKLALLAGARRVCVGAALLLAGLGGAVGEAGRSQAELRQLRQSIGDLQQQLASESRQEKAAVAVLEQLERRLGELRAQQRQASADLSQGKVRQRELRQRQIEIEQRIEDSRDDLIRLVRAHYMLGRHSALKLILSQQDPTATARSLSIFRYLSAARNQRIEHGAQLRRELLQTRAEAAQWLRQVEKSLAQLAENEQQLAATRAARARTLAAIRADMQHNRQQVAVFQHREQKLAQLLARLRRDNQPATADSAVPDGASSTEGIAGGAPSGLVLGGFGRRQGEMMSPIDGKIRARFGQRKPESGLKWEGLMFAAAEGEAVRAIHPGQVVFSDWFRGYGQLMVIDHGDGYMSLYGHNRALRAPLGAAIRAGQPIGEAGVTGGLRHAGLYFEIRHHGEPRDPLQWCRI